MISFVYVILVISVIVSLDCCFKHLEMFFFKIKMIIEVVHDQRNIMKISYLSQHASFSTYDVKRA